MAPKDLPLEEVKQYLSFLSFQPRDLAEATRKRRFHSIATFAKSKAAKCSITGNPVHARAGPESEVAKRCRYC